MVNLGINVDVEGWKKYICEKIQEGGRRAWKDGFNDAERQKEYVRIKNQRNESLPFFGHADLMDGWRCYSQNRVMSRPIQVRQL